MQRNTVGQEIEQHLLDLIIRGHFSDVNEDVSDDVGANTSVEAKEPSFLVYKPVNVPRPWHLFGLEGPGETLGSHLADILGMINS